MSRPHKGKADFYSRVMDWYQRGYCAIATSSTAPYIVPITDVLRANSIECHVVYTGKAPHRKASIYVLQGESDKAQSLTHHLPRDWWEASNARSNAEQNT